MVQQHRTHQILVVVAVVVSSRGSVFSFFARHGFGCNVVNDLLAYDLSSKELKRCPEEKNNSFDKGYACCLSCLASIIAIFGRPISYPVFELR